MRASLRHVFWFVAGVFLCHAALFGGASFSARSNVSLDSTFAGWDTNDQVRYVVSGILGHGIPSGRNLVFLGASNAQLGFRPKEMTSLFPNCSAHNLCFFAAKIGDIRNVLELVCGTIPEEDIPSTCFLVGFSFPSFFAERPLAAVSPLAAKGTLFPGIDESRPIDIGPLNEELVRWHLFSREGQRVSSRFLPGGLCKAEWLFRPALYAETQIDAAKRHALAPVRTFLAEFLPAPRGSGMDEDDSNPDDVKAKQDEALMWWLYSAGGKGLPDEEFEELLSLCALTERLGVPLVLMDLPLPAWHRESSSLYPIYREKLDRIRPALEAFSSVQFIDLHALDVEFLDSTHPTQAASLEWAKALRARVNLPWEEKHGNASAAGSARDEGRAE